MVLGGERKQSVYSGTYLIVKNMKEVGKNAAEINWVNRSLPVFIKFHGGDLTKSSYRNNNQLFLHTVKIPGSEGSIFFQLFVKRGFSSFPFC